VVPEPSAPDTPVERLLADYRDHNTSLNEPRGRPVRKYATSALPTSCGIGSRSGRDQGLTATFFNVTVSYMNVGARTRPYRQVARAQAQQRTRDALIAAAHREFHAGRWEEASLDAIAASARVTKQTLLRHFGSKDGLLEQAIQWGFDEVRDQRFNAPRGDVAGAVDNLLDHYERWGERAIRIGAVDGLGEVAAGLGRRARQLHYDWVEHAFGSSLQRLSKKDRSRRRAALIALCDVHTWRLLSHDLELPRAEVRATLINAIESLIPDETKK
jgi:AcrR family transcriptional regulator